MERESLDAAFEAQQASAHLLATLETFRQQYQNLPTTPPGADSECGTTPVSNDTIRLHNTPVDCTTLHNQEGEQLSQSCPQGPHTTREEGYYHFQVYWQLQRAGQQLRDIIRVVEHEQIHRDFSDDRQRYLTRRRILQDDIESLRGDEARVAQVELYNLERQWAREEERLAQQVLDFSIRRPAILDQFNNEQRLRRDAILEEFLDERTRVRDISLYEVLCVVRRTQVEEEAPQQDHHSGVRMTAEERLVPEVRECVVILRTNINQGRYILSMSELAILDRITDYARRQLFTWSNIVGTDFNSIDPYTAVPTRDFVPTLQSHPSAPLRWQIVREQQRDQREQFMHRFSQLEQEHVARRSWNFPRLSRRRRQPEPGQLPRPIPSLIRDYRRLASIFFLNRQRGEPDLLPEVLDDFQNLFGDDDDSPEPPRPIKSYYLTPRKLLDDRCGICLNDFDDVLADSAKGTWCLVCGQNAHSKCIENWHDRKERFMRSCPFCRSAWHSEDEKVEATRTGIQGNHT